MLVNRTTIAALAFFVLVALAPDRAWAQTSEPYGLWLTEKKGVIVDVYDCDGALCARTVWLKKPRFKDGSIRLDRNNPDPSLRTRPWCGMVVITGVRPDGRDVWRKGKIYDPKSGRRYSIDMRLKDGRMHVRGYLGTPLVGKSEVWSRPGPDMKPGCVTAA